MAHIKSLATAVPEHRYGQDAIYAMLFKDRPGFGPKSQLIFEKAAIANRHSVLADPSFLLTNPGTQERNAVYVKEAHRLAAEAARRCLDQSGYTAQDIDTFVVVSCTGYEIPGLDLTLASELGMRPNVRRTCVLGMGCYAAFPGLYRARDSVLAHKGSRALMVAVELCSLHFQPDDTDDNVVACALFADGAAAVLLEGAGTLEVVDTETLTQYDTAEHMAFHMTNHGFKMYLSSYVPQILSLKVEALLRDLLERNGLDPSQVRHWGIHPGGRKIIDHLQQGLGLRDEQVASSRRVLRDYGNMSSPTVLFVLEDILRHTPPEPGDHAVLMAFGPGLTLEAVLLRWS